MSFGFRIVFGDSRRRGIAGCVAEWGSDGGSLHGGHEPRSAASLAGFPRADGGRSFSEGQRGAASGRIQNYADGGGACLVAMAISTFLAQDEIMALRKTKRAETMVNIRPMIPCADSADGQGKECGGVDGARFLR